MIPLKWIFLKINQSTFMNIAEFLAQSLSISLKQVTATIKLLDEGATVPFISRYRKEATGGLDEVQVEDIRALKAKIEELEKRKEVILASILEQGKLTPELKKAIEACTELSTLEDLYLPYKPKRKTRATVAIEKGLEPLAFYIFTQQNAGIESKARQYITADVPDVKAALDGANDIMAEWISEDARARASLRKVYQKSAIVTSKLKKGKELEAQKYLDYFDFSEPLAKIPSHRMLAIRRGEDEKFLNVSITPDVHSATNALEFIFLRGLPEPKKYVKLAMDDSLDRLLMPSLENEFFGSSKKTADVQAIAVFAENLRQLLLACPLGQKVVLAIDPGYRTGCKVVVLDANANLIKDTVIYPHHGTKEWDQAVTELKALIAKYKVEAIAVGNGTASRETETLAKQCVDSQPVFMVSEQGASIYSASAVAREEFPTKDVTVRGAVSIGRRLIDPLAELVKIDPKSIGVGQYQHDVDQKLLKENLDTVVVSCVNRVGVNLNTASKHLLAYVSGLGPSLAQNIVDYRSTNGNFNSRNDLKKVPRLGDKAFEQSAGFLRITKPKNPLDATSVHPESYDIVKNMASDLHCTVQDLIQKSELRKQIDPKKYVTASKGLHTLNDILKELEKPGLDPREPISVFEFDRSVRTIDDLITGQWLPGIVTNITAFGAFVDLGVKQDGLLHISAMADTFIKDPNTVVKLGQQLVVQVIEVDIARKRIALSLKNPLAKK
jgi:protein Tex